MRRALFLREFRLALLPSLATVAAILAPLIIVERLHHFYSTNAEDVRSFTGAAFLIGLVVSGFVSGERCFSSELKEYRIFFLSSLPLSRSWIWFGIVTARLSAALPIVALSSAVPIYWMQSGFAGVLSENPSWQSIKPVLILCLFYYIVLFSAGTMFALLFRRPLLAYVVGASVLGLLLLDTVFACSLPRFSRAVPLSSVYPNSTANSTVVRLLVLLLMLALLLSRQCFVHGEIANAKHRVKNQILLVLAALGYLGVVFCATTSPKIASIGSIWVSFEKGSVSPDGKYLAILESSKSNPVLAKITVIDSRSGHRIGRAIYFGAYRIFWSSSRQGDVLSLIKINSSPLDRLGYLVVGTVDWVRLSPDTREISRRRLRGAEAVEAMEGGRGLAVQEKSGQGRLFLLDGATGRSSEVARAPLDGQVLIGRDGPTALVYFDNELGPKIAWAVDSQLREVRVPPSHPKPTDDLFQDASEFFGYTQAELLWRFASPLDSRRLTH